MKKRTNTLLWILAVVFLVGLVNSSNVTWTDVRRPLIIASFGVWITALVTLLSRRDIEIHSKLTWVVTVLLLNGVGGLLYFILGPSRRDADIGTKQRKHTEEPSNPDDTIDPDAEPIEPAGQSWNPILGVNRFAAGEGLNPSDEKQSEKT